MLAEEILNKKRRYLINQIGGERRKTGSVSAQNQVSNAPVSSGTRSRSSAAASGGNDDFRNKGRGYRGNQINRGNRGYPVYTGNRN